MEEINIPKKQTPITGAASTITDSDLTANAVMITNSSGKATASTVVSVAELNTLNGCTSKVQTQIDALTTALETADYVVETGTKVTTTNAGVECSSAYRLYKSGFCEMNGSFTINRSYGEDDTSVWSGSNLVRRLYIPLPKNSSNSDFNTVMLTALDNNLKNAGKIYWVKYGFSGNDYIELRVNWSDDTTYCKFHWLVRSYPVN